MAMTEAFLVDRAQALSEGATLDLTKHTDMDPPTLQGHVDGLFPDGVTRHGDFYFLGSHSQSQAIEPNIELIYEYVRRACFPEVPSRFQSVFACATLDEAKRFRDSPDWSGTGAPIWKVATPHAGHRVDMTLLTHGLSILMLSYRAHRYWSGAPNNMHEFGVPRVEPFWELLLRPPVTVIEQVD